MTYHTSTFLLYLTCSVIFCFLCALQTKNSTEVASRLIEIFSDIGPPLRIQSDHGSEFKGSVKKLKQALKVIDNLQQTLSSTIPGKGT